MSGARYRRRAARALRKMLRCMILRAAAALARRYYYTAHALRRVDVTRLLTPRFRHAYMRPPRAARVARCAYASDARCMPSRAC